MVPSIEPTQLSAGDTAKWTRSFSDYPASAGWELSYALRNATSSIDIDGAAIVAAGDGFAITIAADTSAAWTAGRYQWSAFVSKDDERYTVGSGEIEILPNLAAAGPVDSRSHNRKMLDALNSVLENRATSDVQQYTIGNRSLTKMTFSELWDARNKYSALVAREEGRLPKFLGARFTRPA